MATLGVLLGLAEGPALTGLRAQTWNGDGAPALWSASENWVGGLPTSDGTAAVLMSSSVAVPDAYLDADWDVRTLAFAGSGGTSPKITGSASAPAMLTLREGLTVTRTTSAAPATILENVRVNLAATQTWDVASNAAVSSLISGSGGLVKSGAGVLTLGLGNTYSGGTVIREGRLSATGDSSLGDAAGAVTLDGGTLFLALGTGGSFSRDLTVGAAGGTLATKATSTLNSRISGSGALALVRDDTQPPFVNSTQLTLTGASTFTGGLTISNPVSTAGALWTIRATGGNTVLGNGLVTVGAKVALAIDGRQNLGAAGRIQATRESGLWVDDQVDPAALLHPASSGASLGLRGATYTRPLDLATLGDGTLAIGFGESSTTYTPATLGAGAGNVYRFGNAVAPDPTVQATFTITGHDNVLTGSASVEVHDTRLILANANDYTGGTVIGASRYESGLMIGTGQSLGSGPVTISGGGLLTMMPGALSVVVTNEIRLTSAPGTRVGLGRGSPGVAIMQVTGTIDLMGGSRSLSGSALHLDGDIVNGALSLTGSVDLSGAKSFAGGLTLGTGTYTVANQASLGVGVVLAEYQPTLVTSADMTLTKPIAFNTTTTQSNLILSPYIGTTLTLASTVGGIGLSVRKAGAGNLVITAPQTQSLVVVAGHATAAGSTLAASAVSVLGTGVYDGTGEAASVTIRSGGTVRPGSGYGLLATSALTGALVGGPGAVEVAMTRPGGVDPTDPLQTGNGLLSVSDVSAGGTLTCRLFFTNDGPQTGDLFQGALFVRNVASGDPALGALMSRIEFEYWTESPGGSLTWNGLRFMPLSPTDAVIGAEWVDTTLGNQSGAILQFDVVQGVPEPGTWALLMSGMAAVVAARKVRRGGKRGQ